MTLTRLATPLLCALSLLSCDKQAKPEPEPAGGCEYVEYESSCELTDVSVAEADGPGSATVTATYTWTATEPAVLQDRTTSVSWTVPENQAEGAVAHARGYPSVTCKGQDGGSCPPSGPQLQAGTLPDPPAKPSAADAFPPDGFGGFSRAKKGEEGDRAARFHLERTEVMAGVRTARYIKEDDSSSVVIGIWDAKDTSHEAMKAHLDEGRKLVSSKGGDAFTVDVVDRSGRVGVEGWWIRSPGAYHKREVVLIGVFDAAGVKPAGNTLLAFRKHLQKEEVE